MNNTNPQNLALTSILLLATVFLLEFCTLNIDGRIHRIRKVTQKTEHREI